MLNGLGVETDRKADVVGSLTNLSHEVDALVQRCSRSGGLATAAFFTFPPYLIFHGSLFVLEVPCAPPTSTLLHRKVDREYSLLQLLNSHFGLVFLTYCPVAVAAEEFCTTWGTTDECDLCSNFAT